jgi:hypothetical protein
MSHTTLVTTADIDVQLPKATDHDAHVAERVAAELPRFGEIREAYEFYQLDSDKAMAAQIFAQQVGEILEAES